MCCVQMRADCMLLALTLMRQWRSITTSFDLSSLVLLTSFEILDAFGDVKLIRPKSPFYDKFKVSFLKALWAVSPHSELYHCSSFLVVVQVYKDCVN